MTHKKQNIFLSIIRTVFSFCILHIVLCINLKPQNVTIKGTVIDDEHKPLELVMIHVEGTTLVGTNADLKGKYNLTCKSADTLVVVFSMVGYQTRKRTLVEPHDTITLDVMLPKLRFELNEVEINEIRRQTNTMTDINFNDTKHMGNASGQ